ncbi:LOW QUALITY PROTEIN: leucine-rich repeat-containing protein 9 [Phoenicopterus ruber ruber]
MDIKRIIVAFHFQYTCNGLSYENAGQEELKPTALEMFFSGYPRIVGMKYFPNITTLILTGQSIKVLDLEYCLLLKELWIAECCVVKIDGPKCVNLQNLYCNISRIENLEALTKLLSYFSHGNEDTEKVFLQKINALEERITFQNRKLNAIKDFQVEMKKSFNLVVQFFLMELETVGNIPFEEGLSNNPWFSSCCDIIQSQFCTWDFTAYSIMEMKINHIFRVHNQILRLKFKDKFQIFLLKEIFKKMESLSYVCNPELPVKEKQMLLMLEDAFQGLVAHTVCCIVDRRMVVFSKGYHRRKQAEKGGLSQIKILGPCFNLCSSLTEKKTFLLYNSLSICECPRIEFLKQAKAEGKNSSDPEKSFTHGKEIIAKVFLGRSAPACAMNPIYQVRYPEANSVFRPWKRLDASTSGNEMQASLEQRNCDCSLWHCKWFVFDHERVLPEHIAEFDYVTLCFSFCDIRRQALDFTDQEKKKQAVCEWCYFLYLMVLNVNGNSPSKLQDISRLKNLQKLIISFNEFTSLNNIYDLPNREYFDASHNHVVTLEGIRGQFFSLSWYQLKKSREDINILHKHTPNLLSLDITHNPWHKLSVISQLKALTNLDGVLFSNEEAAEALQYIAGSKMTQVSLLEYPSTDEGKTPILVFSCTKILSQICKNKVDSQMHRNNWYSMITVLNLDDQHFKISNLEKLEHLRWASFSNNLTQIEGMGLNLQELTSGENCISTLDGISKLAKLTRLRVNNNHLISLRKYVFENLSHPHYISIENNRITSFIVNKTYSLIKLYISNNFVTTNQEIHHLKGLPNLIVLDMSRNIVWKQDHYQLFVLFHLPSLKALDGITVEPTEGESAKDLFGGKLTSDMIADRLHSDFTEMQELNWTTSNIRAVELLLADQFRNLEHNNLISFSGLIFLPNAKVLCLNYNHVESILPGQKLLNQVTNRQQLYKVASRGYEQEGLAKGSKGTEFGENVPLIMQSLEDFHLGYNEIMNMAQLQFSRLKILKLLICRVGGNYISQIEDLEGLQFLVLVLDHNHMKMISQGFLNRQNGLLTLHVEQNQIQEPNSLQPLVKLQKLFLDFNRIQESSELEKGFPVANSPEDSGFPTLTANFTRHNPLRITNGNLNENINHLFGSDLTFGHELEEPLLTKSNENKSKNPGITKNNLSIHAERALRQAKGAATNLLNHLVHHSATSQTSQLHQGNTENAGR